MDKKIKYIVVLILWFCDFGLVLAQNASLNHSKYWFYRTRLRNEFMAVGSDQVDQCGAPLGMNIPATSAYEDGQDIHFGDGTSFLGNFMAVLATEHRLMERSGASEDQKLAIRQELYWCMKTYERLDKQAEVLFTPKAGNCGNEINGFFVRDDVNENVVSKLGTSTYNDEFNQTKPKKITTSAYLDAHDVPLEYLDNVGDPGPSKAPFPSTDQITNLLVGFAFVKKLMSNPSYNYNGYNFGSNASHYTSKIMDYYSKARWDLEIPNTPPSYSLDNPNANHTISLYGGVQSMIMGYPLARAGENVYTGLFGNGLPSLDNWNGTTSSLSITTWNCLNWPTGLRQYMFNYKNESKSAHNYQNAISSQLAAIGNSWEYGLIPNKTKYAEINIPCTAIYWDNCRTGCLYCYKWRGRKHCNCRTVCGPRWASWDCGQKSVLYMWHYETQFPLACAPDFGGGSFLSSEEFSSLLSINVPFPLPKIAINVTGLALNQYGVNTQTEIFSLEHRFLHGGKQHYFTNALVNYLNTAPCTGPHRNPKHDPHNPESSGGVVGWQTENRFEKSNDEYVKNHDGNGGWNGIDYMLLHNLYYSLHGSSSEISGFRNEMDYNLVDPTHSSRTYNGFETLTASNTVNTGTNIALHAGKWVKMNGGFKASTGSIFKAYTQYTFPCDATTGYKDAEQPPIVEQPTTDTPPDSATVMNEIAVGLQHTKDSLSPKVDSVVQAGKYQPLSEFVKTPVQMEEVPSSRILSVFPNPLPPTGTVFGVNVFMAQAGALGLALYDFMGNQISPIAHFTLPQGESELQIGFYSPNPAPQPGLYYLKALGDGLNSSYKVSIQ